MTYADASFDSAYMMHVGMNIADKSSLMGEVYRVLKPGGQFGVYDVMRMSEDEITFPVPWASDASGSAVDSVEEYKQALKAAGFEISAERNRHQFAIDFFDTLMASAAASSGPPPLGLHIVMGSNAPEKVANMVENVRKAKVAPVEIVATKSK
jgi:SAM-dependent methyltransferase